ncbi:WD40 repeat domain-containing protein [Leptolyngbya sp. NIES-2104]|uniref:WD40 repeat domain-containing protein n=1 Tax=Leptolyngbya sp. NIES-2104 TaxID=1552121 RepID=UPI0006EC9C73|nr:WD40 repeat domain-containing protein [Leptolyngbya sp. NIES-2104]GAP98886.1 high-affnity carbon uptake protein Hat/HatR [Leptolyngbya sp. NIES-2104]
MFLLLGQLIYTSFPKVGFQALSSAAIPPEILQAFIDQIVYQHWDAYNPPEANYRAVYLSRIAADQTLFGWLYNDGADDLGRNHVPYFICYYYAGELQPEYLDVVFTCLEKGAATVVDRQTLPDQLESVIIPDHETYQPARMGVAIPQDLRDQTCRSLQQEKLFKLFVSGTFTTALDSYLEELSLKVLASTSGGRKAEVSPLQPANYEQILLSRAKTLAPQTRSTPIKLEILVSLIALISTIAVGFLLFQNLSKSPVQPANQSTVRSNSLTLARTLNSSPAWSVLLDGQTVISGSEDRTIKVWNIETGTILNTLSGHTDVVRSLALTADRTLISGSGDRTIKLWNLQTNQLIQTLDHGSPVWSIATYGDRLFSVGEDGTLKIWSLSSQTVLQSIRAHENRIFSVVISPDGKTIATAGLDRTIKLWNAQTGEAIRTLTGHNDAVRALAFSPDGQSLMSASWDQTVKQWNWQTGELVHTFEGHTARVVSIAVSPDGQRLVSGSIDNTVRMWSIQERKLLQTLNDHKDWVLSVAIDRDRVVSGSKDQTIRVWKH